MFHGLNNEYLYSAFKIEVEFADDIGNVKSASGTGFFVKNSKDELCLVTNRHVLDINYKNISGKDYSKYTLYTVVVKGKGRDATTGNPDIDVALHIAMPNLKFDSNINNDIACLISPQICAQNSINPTIDYFLPKSILATTQQFQSNLHVCDFLAFPGYPPWHDVAKIRPILRTGTISSDPRYNYQYKQSVLGDCTAYEAFSFGGSSGSPVFAIQKGPKPGPGISFPGYRELLLVGINAGHLRTNKDEHSGISYFYKSYAILSLIG
ncbi:hypothetical protein [Thalassotalea ganghwensis]